MDKRPITQDRARRLDRSRDAKLLDDMGRLARQTYLEFDLGSVIRLDLRADDLGKLHILEANPKPDLKAPTGSVTSLICAGLGDIGLDYDSLILSLLADRLDFLFTRRPDMVKHLLELAESQTLFDLMKWPTPDPETLQALISRATDLNVVALNTALKAARHGAETVSDGPPASSWAAGAG